MAKLTDQELDDLFRDRLLKMEKDLPADSWSTLAKDVSKNNFLKFSWKHFNVFYAGAISVVAVSSILYFTTTNQSPKENPSVRHNPAITTDTIASIPSVPETIEEKINTPSIEKKKKTDAKINSSASVETIVPDKTETKTDSASSPLPDIENKQPVTTPVEKKESIVKPKKIITILKRDTIRVKDTVNVERIKW